MIIDLKKIITFIPVFCLMPSHCFGAAEEQHGLLLNSSISLSHDDNIIKSSNKIEDQILSIKPIALFNSSIGKHDVKLQYSGEYTAFNDNSSYNFNAHDIATGIVFDHSYRMSTELEIFYQKNIEAPNSTNAINLNTNEYNYFNQKGLVASWLYGKEDSNGQIVFTYTHADKNFTNNQQSFRDLKQNGLSGTFFYKLSNISRLLFLARVEDFDYQNTVFNDQSSKQYSALTGFVWRTSNTTTGEFKIGYQTKKYNDINFKDIDGLTYMLDMKWTPNTYTLLSLGSSKNTTESAISNQQGYTSTSYFVDLEHKLTNRTDVEAGFQYSISDLGRSIVDTNTVVRKDDIYSANFGVKHSLRKWLNIEFTYTHERRSSINTLFEFNSNIFTISLETNFE